MGIQYSPHLKHTILHYTALLSNLEHKTHRYYVCNKLCGL